MIHTVSWPNSNEVGPSAAIASEDDAPLSFNPVSTILVQRVITHYRLPLLRALYATYGIKTVCAEALPSGTGLSLVDPAREEFAIPAPFVFPDPADAFRVTVPLDWIMDNLAPSTIISEFGLKQSVAWQLPLARRRGRFRTLIFWTHGWQMERGFVKPTDLASQMARIAAFGAADAIATYTEEGARWIRRVLPWKRVTALGNTLDVNGIRSIAAQATARRDGSPQLLTIGRFSADKRIDLAIEAFARVKVALPGASLTVIGDGPERPALERLAAAEVGSGIRFTGAIYKEEELAPHFLGADVYILAGAAGLSVNHALAYSLPIAAFPRRRNGPHHHPEIAYIVEGETGLLVQPPTPDALARAIVESYVSGRLEAMRDMISHNPVVPTIEDMVTRFGTLPGITVTG